MVKKRIRVAVNGYGVIGKRVADAVIAQDDMELIGVADIVSELLRKPCARHTEAGWHA